MNRLIRAVGDFHRRLIFMMAALAGVLLLLIAFLVVVDVLLRNLGTGPLGHTLTLTEYGLLYITMLAAPWLVRVKGQVYIELLTSLLSATPRRIVSISVSAVCLITCLILAWYGAQVSVINFERMTMDVRSFDMPRYLLFAAFPVGFGLMAVEFTRFVIGRDDLHTGQAGIHE